MVHVWMLKRGKMAYDFLVIGATGAQGRIATRHLLEHGYSVMLREGIGRECKDY